MKSHTRQSFRHRLLVAILFLFMGGWCVLAGCSGSGSDATVTTGGSGTTGDARGVGGASVIEVIGSDGVETYTLDEVRAMPATEGYGGTRSSTGRITPPVLTKGVLLEQLFAAVGGLFEDMAVTVAAKDGYEMTLSVAQLRSGDFITYDMVTGDENEVEGPLEVIVAYEYDGMPIDPESEGPLRLAIVGPEMNQVTDGHYWVKWVTEVQLKPVEPEWTLLLTGKLTEEMDRPTFETGAAEGCHGHTWTDPDGNTWTGIPLYLLVGRVDDNNVHEGPAYNRRLAEAGYQVEIKTADGNSIEVASGTMYYNKDLIVAHRLNGGSLPLEYWPLRLVGEGIEGVDMVGQITQIQALVPVE